VTPSIKEPETQPLTAQVYDANKSTSLDSLFVFAHGAGAGQAHPFMTSYARGLADRGVSVVTFNFPYMEQKRRTPDRAPVLEDAFRRAVVDALQRRELHGKKLFIGGKSMGGRIASHVAAQGVEGVAGLVFFGYPLHPPGRPEQRRDAHLPAVAQPMLFVQGSADAFGSAEEIRALLPRLSRGSVLHEIASGDHSFKVPARTGRTPSDVMKDVLDAVASFIRALV